MRKLFTLFALAAVSFSAQEAAAQLLSGETLKVGDRVTIDGVDYLIGRNVITNPNFEMDPAENDGKIVGWNLGNYAQMMATTNGGTFIWHSEGGHDGGPYIQANSHTGAGGTGSIGTRWSVEPNAKYYMSFWLAKNSENNQYIPVVSLTSEESTAGGQHETSNANGSMIIGKNGGTDVTDDLLGYGAYNGGDWAQTQFYFDTHDYTYLQFNARWLKEGDIQACFDDFYLGKLYDEATTEKYELLQIELNTLIEEASDYASDIDYAYVIALQDAIEEAYDFVESTDEEELSAAIDALEAAKTEAENCASIVENLVALIEANADLTETGYPGAEAFEEAYSKAQDILDDEDADSKALSAALAEFQQAILDYNMSQEVGENGADYTFAVTCANFTKSGGDVSNSEDRASTGWEIGPSGGDQRLNTIGGLNCWNAWRSAFAPSYVDVHQSITNLPNGKYKVSADMITQTGMAYQQRVYAESTLGTVASPYLEAEGWDSEEYTNLETTDYAIVTDGKLTIGARGEGRPDATDASGWFCVTNFKLSYFGEASEEEIAAASEAKIAEFSALLEEVKAYVADMKLAGDKAAFDSIIVANESYESALEIAEKQSAINAAYTTAQSSVAKYEEIVETEGKSYPSIGANLNAATFGDALPLVQAGYNGFKATIEASDATYTDMDANLAKLKKYASYNSDEDEFSGAFEKYNSMLAYANSSDATVAKAIADTKANVDAIMIDNFATTTEADSAITLMNKAVKEAAATEGLANHGADYTDYITNPTIEASGNTVVPEGWTCDRPVGDKYTTTGQSYIAESSDRYLDCWNSAAGAVRYTASQTLNVPNGTYEVKALTRTSGSGSYLFAIPGKDVNVENGIFTEIENSGDVAGSIWTALNERVEANEELSDEELDMWGVHNATGYGWGYSTVEVEVTDHVLTIGVTCDSTFYQQSKQLAEATGFTGTWFSADNFTLTLKGAVQEDANWSPIATGIETVEATKESIATAADGIYTIDGVKVSAAKAKGVYLIKKGNDIQKVYIK
jgi:hypothetical protein